MCAPELNERNDLWMWEYERLCGPGDTRWKGNTDVVFRGNAQAPCRKRKANTLPFEWVMQNSISKQSFDRKHNLFSIYHTRWLSDRPAVIVLWWWFLPTEGILRWQNTTKWIELYIVKSFPLRIKLIMYFYVISLKQCHFLLAFLAIMKRHVDNTCSSGTNVSSERDVRQ